MKKAWWIVIIAVIVVIVLYLILYNTGVVQFSPAGSNCIDSDRGINSTVYGVVTLKIPKKTVFGTKYSSSNYLDTCKNSITLLEKYCRKSLPSAPSSDVLTSEINCTGDYSCINGACRLKSPNIIIKSSAEQRVSVQWTNKNDATYNLEMFMPKIIGNRTYVKLGYYDEINSYNYSIRDKTMLHRNDYFITTSGQYSQIWRVNAITLNSNEQTVTVTDQGKKNGVGYDSVKLTLSGASVGSTGTLTLDDGNTATIILSENGTDDTTTRSIKIINGVSDILYTKEGAAIKIIAIIAPVVSIDEVTEYSDRWKEELDKAGGNFGNFLRNISYIDLGFVYKNGTIGNDFRIDYVNGTKISEQRTVGDYDSWFRTRYGTLVKKSGANDPVVSLYLPS